MVRSSYRCLVAIFVFAAPAIAQQAASEPKSRMSGQEISAAFSGMTMTGNYGNGVNFTETYRPGGAIDYQDDQGSDSGRWFVRGNLFCTFYDSSEGACYSVRRSAGNCYEYFTEEDESGTAHENAGNWNSVGWDRKKPSECDLADKTS